MLLDKKIESIQIIILDGTIISALIKYIQNLVCTPNTNGVEITSLLIGNKAFSDLG